MSGTASRPKLLTRPFLLVALANLLLGMAGWFALHFPGFLAQLGAGEAEIGRIMAVQSLTAMAVGPVVGRVMDRRGRRIVILTGCALYVCVASLYLAISSLGPFVYFVRAVEGVSSNMLYAALFTFAADVVPKERRTEGLALFGASGLAPMALSGLLGDAILSVTGYRGVFLAALTFGVLGALPCLALHDVTKPGGVHPEERPLASVAAQRDLIPVWGASFAFFFSVAGLFAFLKTFVLARGFGSVGTFFSVYAGVAIVLRAFFGALPDRIGPQRMVLPALLSYGAGMALLGQAQGSSAMLLAGALCGAGHGYAYPVLLSLVVTRAPLHERGAAMAIYTGIDFAGNFAAPPVLGLVIEHAGYGRGFPSVCGLLAGSALAFVALDRRARGRAREAPPQASI